MGKAVQGIPCLFVLQMWLYLRWAVQIFTLYKMVSNRARATDRSEGIGSGSEGRVSSNVSASLRCCVGAEGWSSLAKRSLETECKPEPPPPPARPTRHQHSAGTNCWGDTAHPLTLNPPSAVAYPLR